MLHKVATGAVIFHAILLAQIDPDALLQRARSQISSSVANLPRYTCVQTVHRSRFESFSGNRPSGCHVGEPGQPPALLAWKDQFKLDITVSEGTEIFSWAGARTFQSGDAQQIVGGGLTGTGDFGPFLTDIFGGEAAKRQYLGTEQDHGRMLAVYRYEVPLSVSGYHIRIGPGADDTAALAYEGKFWLDPQNAELIRMTIVVPRPPLESD